MPRPVAANLVAAAGGRIEVDSQVGAGSVFRILLPTYPVLPAAMR